MTDAPPSVPARLEALLADVRAMGPAAPLRGLYEASKRFGGHRIVFRGLVPTGARRTGRSPLPVLDVPEPVRHRTLAFADAVVGGTIELFGRRFRLGDPPDWHAAVEGDGTWPRIDWWRIDVRSPTRPGDVKWVWELGRHRHLVVVARAARLAPDDGRYVDLLDRHLASWLDANPPEVGIHWYSNLEIALRSLAWLEILGLVGSRLDGAVRAGMWHHLHHGARHLVADLPYTLTAMRNNHLLGDALGLVALGKAFGGSSGRRWARLGDRLFRAQLRRQVRPDGSMIDDAVSYQRFVLEMLTVRVLLGDPPPGTAAAALAAAGFLARLGCLDGPVPRYGDWDEGRVLAVAGDAADLAGSVRLALAVAGTGAPAPWREAHDEVAWFTAEGRPAPADPAEVGGGDLGGGLARATVGAFTVWLKAGSGPSHGHADLTSVAVAHDGTWVVGDPGTATYDGSSPVRNRLRGSAAHDVLRVGGEDQLVPHRAFRWRHRAHGAVGEPVALDGRVVMWGVHDAYRRLDPPRRVVRAVIVAPETVTVVDWVEGGPVDADLTLPLPPTAAWDPATGMVTVGRATLGIRAVAGDGPVPLLPIEGLWSDTYGSVSATVFLTAHTTGGGPRVWEIYAAGQRQRLGIVGDVAEVGPVRVSVAFLADGVVLTVEGQTGAQRRRLDG